MVYKIKTLLLLLLLRSIFQIYKWTSRDRLALVYVLKQTLCQSRIQREVGFGFFVWLFTYSILMLYCTLTV